MGHALPALACVGLQNDGVVEARFVDERFDPALALCRKARWNLPPLGKPSLRRQLQGVGLRFADEASGRHAGVGGRKKRQAATGEPTSQDGDHHRRIDRPRRPELPAQASSPATDRPASSAPGEQRHHDPVYQPHEQAQQHDGSQSLVAQPLEHRQQALAQLCTCPDDRRGPEQAGQSEVAQECDSARAQQAPRRRSSEVSSPEARGSPGSRSRRVASATWSCARSPLRSPTT